MKNQKKVQVSYVNNNHLYKYGKDKRCFSGEIKEADFITSGRPEVGRSIYADRVTSAYKFDSYCENLRKNHIELIVD